MTADLDAIRERAIFAPTSGPEDTLLLLDILEAVLALPKQSPTDSADHWRHAYNAALDDVRCLIEGDLP